MLCRIARAERAQAPVQAKESEPTKHVMLSEAKHLARAPDWARAFAALRMTLVSLAVILVGCKSLGPQTVPRDRSDYASAISESWKRQALLNIVKLRYMEPPIFVDVGQIVAGYTLETTVSAGASLPENASFGAGNTGTVAGAARFTDRPTITYVPLTGNRFIKGLMTPIPPESVFFTIQSGWPADGVLFASVSSINGLKNQETALGRLAPPDPDFLKVLALMRKLQLSGTVGLRVQLDAKQQQSTLLTIRTQELSEETKADSRELRRLLKLDPNATSFRLVFGGAAADNKEVAVLTRSILHLMQTMSSHVQVPSQHVREGRVAPGIDSVTPDPNSPRLVNILGGKNKPDDSFVAVTFRDNWFWIDDRDLRSKRTFTFMMMLFTLADTGEKENLPLVTIPAQ